MNKGFPGGSDGKEFACNIEDVGLIPGLGRSPALKCQEGDVPRMNMDALHPFP